MIIPYRRLSKTLALLLLLPIAVAVGEEPPSPDVAAPPAYDAFVVIPLRVHVLSAPELPEADCHLTDADIRRIVSKVNAIWHNAGIHWGLEPLVREPAARQARFRLARDLDGPRALGLFQLLIPDATRAKEGLNVYYIHQFPVNGVWLGEGCAIIQETARLRPVEGGIDEPIPRVTAHELGHALGLPHRQDRTNLLASGTTGTRLNAREVEVARREALAIPGAATVVALRGVALKAVEDDRRDRARQLFRWLTEVPGSGAVEAKKRLDALGDERGRDPKPAG